MEASLGLASSPCAGVALALGALHSHGQVRQASYTFLYWYFAILAHLCHLTVKPYIFLHCFQQGYAQDGTMANLRSHKEMDVRLTWHQSDQQRPSPALPPSASCFRQHSPTDARRLVLPKLVLCTSAKYTDVKFACTTVQHLHVYMLRVISCH